ncbi:unnamed protein product [Ceutorhynchus assimilis]|uniref:Uncharacterized protein n=1 Tax=Ceutorhynchus assimilis TaxID=467358 RepID=A0A9N9MJP4_9CUCU|nr:unnamed protein product [Ceutorhynchus assimilis]
MEDQQKTLIRVNKPKTDTKADQPHHSLQEPAAGEPIKNKDVSLSLLEVQTKKKLDQYINLAGPVQVATGSPLTTREPPTKDVRGNNIQHRGIILGTNNTANNHQLKAVPRKSSSISTTKIHITRLDPFTTASDLEDYIKIIFNVNLRVEKLTFRYPDSYSSFRMAVPKPLVKDMLAPENWLEGVGFVSYKEET